MQGIITLARAAGVSRRRVQELAAAGLFPPSEVARCGLWWVVVDYDAALARLRARNQKRGRVARRSESDYA